jgi:hypothetical protein
MWILLLQNYRHILRTRLLAFLLAFSVLIQFMGLRLLNNVSFDFDGHMVLGSLIDKRDVIFVSLFLQLFTGTFLSAVYGIWMVPYLHRGPRSPLTFTLPVPKWMYPVSYALTMLTLLGLLYSIMFASYALVFGPHILLDASFPWKFVGGCLGIETLAFEVLTFAFAVCSLTLGEVGTFFVGVSAIVALQVAALLFRVNSHYLKLQTEAVSLGTRIYESLPPVGELVFDLYAQFKGEPDAMRNIVLWAVWLVIFAIIFRVKLSFPSKVKTSES